VRPAAHAPASGADGGATNGATNGAIDAYRRGDLETARSAWLAALETRGLPAAERARILYDLGNVAFRRGAVPEAIGWYTAALRLRPRDADTWANLEHARAQAQLPPADRGDLSATLARLLGALTPAESEWLVIAATLAWLVVLSAEALRGGRALRRVALIATGVVVLALVPWVYQLSQAGGDPLLVIAEPKVSLHSEPRASAAVVGDAELGLEVERLDELPGWVKVRRPGGLEGWTVAEGVFALRR
jgi:tetratricopeptide (TPR) repeat protein